MNGRSSHRNKAAFANFTGSVWIGPERSDQNRVIQSKVAWQAGKVKLSALRDAFLECRILKVFCSQVLSFAIFVNSQNTKYL